MKQYMNRNSRKSGVGAGLDCLQCYGCHSRFASKGELILHLRGHPECVRPTAGAGVGVVNGPAAMHAFVQPQQTVSLAGSTSMIVAHPRQVISMPSGPSMETLVPALDTLTLGSGGKKYAESSHSVRTVVETVVMEQPVPATTIKTKAHDLDICALLDLSGSMSGSKAQAVQTHLEEFIFGPGSCVMDADRVQIVGFDSNHRELQAPTKRSDMTVTALRGLGIAGLRGFGGGTRLWDAVKWCVDRRVAYVQSRRAKVPAFEPKPFVLMVLTDGEDGGSAVSVAVLQTLLAHPGFPHCHVHFVGLGAERSFEAMRMLSMGIEHVQFSVVTEGSAGVIQGIFRKHFAATVQRVRNIVCQRVSVTDTMVVDGRSQKRTTDQVTIMTTGGAAVAGAGTGVGVGVRGRLLIAGGTLATADVGSKLGQGIRTVIRPGLQLAKAAGVPDVCVHFQQGTCKFGMKCRFRHV
jgi:uncharacterized protein YegL